MRNRISQAVVLGRLFLLLCHNLRRVLWADTCIWEWWGDKTDNMIDRGEKTTKMCHCVVEIHNILQSSRKFRWGWVMGYAIWHIGHWGQVFPGHQGRSSRGVEVGVVSGPNDPMSGPRWLYRQFIELGPGASSYCIFFSSFHTQDPSRDCIKTAFSICQRHWQI